jgi:hypothetical protein
MTALDLLLHLTAAGCQLTRQGDTLRVHDPRYVLTDALRQQIREHKAALLAMLTPERKLPLPCYPARCWGCLGPSERQGLRYLLCATCLAQERQDTVGEPPSKF